MSKEHPQAVLLGARAQIPCATMESQMRNGLRDAWTVNGRVIYAHPERFGSGELTRMLQDGEAEAVAVKNNCDAVLGWAALINKPIGNREIGSVNAQRGFGTPLMEELFKMEEAHALERPFLLVDEGGLRTAMGSAAEKAADSTGLRVPVPVYVSPNVYGEVNRQGGTVWGCYGTIQVSTTYLSKNGAIILPRLPEDEGVHDGSEAIIDDVILIGNIEGQKRGIEVFGNRQSVGKADTRSVHKVTDGLLEVDYFDTETRRELVHDGYKPFGIDLGMIDGQVSVGVHYSNSPMPETWFGKQTCFTEGEHPLRSVSSIKTAFAELVRVRQQTV